MLSKEAPKHVEHRQYIFSLSILLLFTYFCFFFQYPQNEEIECLSWTQPKERWCHVAKWHNGSRECVCNGLSSYVLNLTRGRDVLMDLKEATAIDGRGYSSHFGKEATAAEATMTSTMIVIVAVSATFLVISVLSAGLLVVYCRRVKVCI